MPDAFAESTALLERLVREIMTETDPAKIDELAKEIGQVLAERERLRTIQALDQEASRLGT